ncbi:hypothetical protein SY27_08260 [Flavobacterium sp. 316]|uniref:hypothetical protein n=1 Tax=Flavobacterium sp. 316 TaxID=1603293 RepID=UPI0005E1E05E|nr:hypothetical protein [Flavobacterium sp. 316]KIX21675.1 hypothetical protein SY27_08260 [Flavobacterium sp. 316]
MLIIHYFKCNFCNKENKIKIAEDDRGALQMKKGDEIPYSCLECHKKDKIHINKIRAIPSITVFAFVSLISILISIVLILFFGLLATLLFGLPMLFYLFQQGQAKHFNSYRIKTK